MRKWQSRLGLQHWGTIRLSVRAFKEMTAAQVAWSASYKDASILFGQKWLNSDHRTDADTEEVIVHELIHLLFADMDDRLEGYFGAGEVLQQYAATREGMCDVLATILISRYQRAK